MKRKLRGFKRSAIELDFNLYRVDVPIPNMSGDELSVIDIHPEGVERTVMLVHGYAGCAETWEHQINYFSKSFRVVAPDLRGHGQSDAPFSRYTMAEMVDDLFAITQHLDFPDQFVLVGHSFGGSICVEYANAYPEQLARLVLVATAGEYPLPKAVSLLYRLPTAFFRPWWKYRPRWNADIHVMKRMMLNNLRSWNGWSLLGNITVPTLVITGERDNYFPRHVFDDVGNTVPNAEIIDIGASKHKVQLERHQAVNRAIVRFADEDKKHSSWRTQLTTDSIENYRPWLDNYAAGTPHTVPVPRRPLHEFLESAADWLPKRKATIFFGSRLTYFQLNRQANQFAHALHGLGIQPGDRVMILLPNMPQFVIAFYGTLKSGGVAVHANPDADAARIIAEVRQTQAKVLVTLSELSKLAQVVQANSDVREVVFTEFETKVPVGVQKQLAQRWRLAGLGSIGDEPTNQEKPDEVSDLTMADLMLDTPFDPPAVGVSSDSLAAILFTSGTTDAPKGVSLTHRNLVANALQTHHWIPDLRYGREVFLSVVPMLHSYGMTMAMNLPIAMGATMVMLPVFEPQLVLEQVKAHGPTFFPGVPSMYSALNSVPGVRSYGLSSIRACLSGAAPLPIEVQETFEKLTLGRLVEGFGLTEASPATHANPINENRRPGSIGVPLPNTDAKIVDLATGEDMSPGQIGQLLVKGPQVMRGYWMQEEATSEVLQDGWLDTGDVAVMDADGFFHVIGRTRDVIRAGEHTVYPRDVEELLYENAKVREVAVVGVPRSADDQKVKAFVVPRSGVELSEDELMALCQRRLEPYAVPWEFEFRETLPRSFTGKIVRRLLVEDKNSTDNTD